MQAPHPAVQAECSRVRRYITMGRKELRTHKRNANRQHRRCLNAITRSFQIDPDLFDSEDFGAPTLSSWDLW